MKKCNEILRGLREDRDLKQATIASLLGTTQQQYSKYETGESELPLRALAILTDYYNVSADFIMGRTECREGVNAVNQKITSDYTVGALVNDILSLSKAAQKSMLEYIGLQKLKEQSEKK